MYDSEYNLSGNGFVKSLPAAGLLLGGATLSGTEEFPGPGTALGIGAGLLGGLAIIGTSTINVRDIPRAIPTSNTAEKTNRKDRGDLLYRWGPGPDTLDDVSTRATAAKKAIGLYGISTSTSPHRSLASRSAPKSQVQLFFPILKTLGPGHYTLILPNPVNQSDIDKLNSLFK